MSATGPRRTRGHAVGPPLSCNNAWGPGKKGPGKIRPGKLKAEHFGAEWFPLVRYLNYEIYTKIYIQTYIWLKFYLCSQNYSENIKICSPNRKYSTIILIKCSFLGTHLASKK